VCSRKRREQSRYLSYLLRLWQTGDGEELVWRASLQSPGSEEYQGFASLEDLFDFLEDRTGFRDDRDSRLARRE
jgi:hypothetical protein